MSRKESFSYNANINLPENKKNIFRYVWQEAKLPFASSFYSSELPKKVFYFWVEIWIFPNSFDIPEFWTISSFRYFKLIPKKKMNINLKN